MTTISAALIAQLDGLFAAWDRSDSPGCALGLAKNGELTYRRDYGMANLEFDTKLTSKSVFYIASTSKQFTAASIMLLARQERLSLDDDVRKYIPEMPQYSQPILIHHLVYHTSGLRDYLALRVYAGCGWEDAFSTADAVRLICRQKELNFLTGSQFAYSNSNYVLMAEIVRRASGQSLREFAAEHIFQPLGMTSTHFDDDHRQIIKQRVVSYDESASGVFRHFIKGIDAVGDGNLLTTVEDLARWDRNFYDERVGGKGFASQMTLCGTLNDGREIDYAAGLFRTVYRGLTAIQHAGGFLGFRTQLLRFPAQRLSVICLSNLAGVSIVALCWKVADLYLAAEGIELGLPQEVARDAPKPAASGAPLAAGRLEDYAGSYRSDELNVTHVFAIEGCQLRLLLSKVQGFLTPIESEVFQMPDWPDVRFAFTRDTRGHVVGFELSSDLVSHLSFVRTSGAEAVALNPYAQPPERTKRL